MTSTTNVPLLGQDLDVALLDLLAPHVRARTFADVGAEKGAIAEALLAAGLSGVAFEPLPRHRDALARLVSPGHFVVHPFAVDERDGEGTLFIASDDKGAELDYFHSLERVDGDVRFRHGSGLAVACRSLASLSADGTLPSPLGVLKIDTEGHDLAVLQGLGPVRPELIACEYFTEGLYAGWERARPEPVVSHMAGLGYRRYVATKRWSEFESCASGPMGFLPGQWGNLFFLSDGLFDRAESDIARFCGECERRFAAKIQSIADDRVAKEAVIQGLISR